MENNPTIERIKRKYHEIRRDRYSMSLAEMQDLLKEDRCDGLYWAFCLGFIRGKRAAANEQKQSKVVERSA